MKIQKGDSLFLYSDGIIDQQNTKRDRFGTNRFTTIISDHINEPMATIKQAIENTFDSYSESEEQRDDITIVALKLN